MTATSEQIAMHNELAQWLKTTPRLKCDWSEEGKEGGNGRYYAIIATVRDENPDRLLRIRIGLDGTRWQWSASGGRSGPYRSITMPTRRENMSFSEHAKRVVDAVKADCEPAYVAALF
ncbi:MAG: hypothetical protein ACTHN5_18005 [Phycisphaerae bacterium]